jgi:hypothetical protein
MASKTDRSLSANDKYKTMTKKTTFLDTPEWTAITKNIKGIMTSDGTMATLMDYERVLDDANIYAYKNWKLGELVDGPEVGRYSVSATFMWPEGLMPDPRAGKRLLTLGCEVKFKKTKIKMPIKIEDQDDYQPGTHYPKMVDRSIWLVNIIMPKDLMNDIREGSVDIADQSIDLEDLDDAYAKDYDEADVKEQEGGGSGMDMGMGGGLPPPASGGLPM